MKGQAHALYETLQVTHFPSDEHAIASGIIRASTIDRTAYDSLSKAAKANAHRRFGITLFGERFGKLITSLAPEGN